MSHSDSGSEGEFKLQFSDLFLNAVSLLLLLTAAISALFVPALTITLVLTDKAAPGAMVAGLVAVLAVLAAIVGALVILAKKIAERRFWAILVCAILGVGLGLIFLFVSFSGGIRSFPGSFMIGVIALAVGGTLAVLRLARSGARS